MPKCEPVPISSLADDLATVSATPMTHIRDTCHGYKYYSTSPLKLITENRWCVVGGGWWVVGVIVITEQCVNIEIIVITELYVNIEIIVITEL